LPGCGQLFPLFTNSGLAGGDIGLRQEDFPMKHPVKNDFEVAVSEASVTVTFKPTNSIYSFYRLADSDDIARLGPVSLAHVRHAGASGDTEDYRADEVQGMAQRIASEVAASVWSVQDEKEADRLTTVRPPPVVGVIAVRPSNRRQHQ
jgi:hypothetical protein